MRPPDHAVNRLKDRPRKFRPEQTVIGNVGFKGPPDNDGALFQSRSGKRLSQQHVDRYLRQLAAQANRQLQDDQRIEFSAHILRHTFLRKVAQEHGVQFAMEAAGHSSSKYIFRYVKPSDDEKEKVLDNLF